MTRLRSRNGCPWDKAQTHSSIKKHLIEEAYEVCDAMDSKDSEKLKDELGDLLFQVIFHAQIAKDRGAFDINDVLRTSLRKMIRRHPHVFGAVRAKDPDDAYKHWQRKKDGEHRHTKDKTLLRGIPSMLPALIKAQKVSRRAAFAGFDWPRAGGIIEKIEEEAREIRKTLTRSNKHRLAEEVGDLLLAVVNLARFKGIDAEDALNKAIRKFVKRFAKMERALRRQGKTIDAYTTKELGRLWDLYT